MVQSTKVAWFEGSGLEIKNDFVQLLFSKFLIKYIRTYPIVWVSKISFWAETGEIPWYVVT